jgi:hypothetical protein
LFCADYPGRGEEQQAYRGEIMKTVLDACEQAIEDSAAGPDVNMDSAKTGAAGGGEQPL